MKYYAKMLRAVKAHFKKDLDEEERYIRLFKKTYGNPKCLDLDSGAYVWPESAPPLLRGEACTMKNRRRHKQRMYNLVKWRQEWLDRLERANASEGLVSIDVSVTFKKNRTWGVNPTAEVWVGYLTKDGDRFVTNTSYATSGSVGGCGYDKESAAVAIALGNLSDAAKAALDRLCIEGGEKAWKQYGLSRTPFPHLDINAKGIETFIGLFPNEWCKKEHRKGYAFPKFVCESNTRSKGFNTYHVHLRRRPS